MLGDETNFFFWSKIKKHTHPLVTTKCKMESDNDIKFNNYPNL